MAVSAVRYFSPLLMLPLHLGFFLILGYAGVPIFINYLVITFFLTRRYYRTVLRVAGQAVEIARNVRIVSLLLCAAVIPLLEELTGKLELTGTAGLALC